MISDTLQWLAATFREFIALFRVIPVTEPIAGRFAEIRPLLTGQGALISDFDMLIGATASLLPYSRSQFLPTKLTSVSSIAYQFPLQSCRSNPSGPPLPTLIQ
jgi:hypothetical protein